RRINIRALSSWRWTRKRWSKLSVAINLRLRPIVKLPILASRSTKLIRSRTPTKAAELSQKINGLQKNLGPEVVALADGLKSVDPNSKDGQEIGSILERLDDLCDD